MFSLFVGADGGALKQSCEAVRRSLFATGLRDRYSGCVEEPDLAVHIVRSGRNKIFFDFFSRSAPIAVAMLMGRLSATLGCRGARTTAHSFGAIGRRLISLPY